MSNITSILGRIPRGAYTAALPVAIIFVVAYFLLFSGGDDEGSQANAVNQNQQQQAIANDAPRPTATSAPVAAAPTATAIPIRQDCNAIRGTDYRSPEERDWFQKNCSGPTTASAGGGGGGGGFSGPASAGVQLATGSRLVIPGSGINVEIYGTVVGANAGILPDPSCYFCAVEYELSAYGLGNRKVLAGHVDCATCHGGGAGAAAFWDITHGGVRPGMTIDYYTGGGIKKFVVVGVQTYNAADINVVELAQQSDMTLITCGGAFDPVTREYLSRTFVYANVIG